MLRVHADHLGTPQSMTDDLGAVVWERHQRPFGETASQTGTASNDRRFPGQLFDAESGYHYNYFRDYDPSIGRYLQSDPIGLEGGWNTYSYVLANPMNLIDPQGLEAIVFGDAADGSPSCVSDEELLFATVMTTWPLWGIACIMNPRCWAALLAKIREFSKDKSGGRGKKGQKKQQEKQGDGEGPARQKGDRFKDGDDASQQFEEIEAQQRLNRKQGYPDRIRSIEKSRQRDQYELDRHKGDVKKIDFESF